MTTPVEWLRDALDTHERIARAADAGPRWSARAPSDGPVVDIGEEVAWSREIDYAVWRCEDEQDGCPDIARGYVAEARHIAANDPAHVLRTVQAHREILDRHDHRGKWCLGAAPQPITGACPDVRSLAAIYRDHPGFDPSWIGES